MFRLSPVLGFGLLLLALLALSSCETTGGGRKVEKIDKATSQLRARAKAEHAIYRSLGAWQKNTYRNKEVLALATPENVSLQISLGEQRGFLLVRGAIAMEFPLATGKASHPTPSGTFHILSKEKDYHSNLYGRIFDAAGTVVVADADSRTDTVPEGGKFVGASMPFWMRLTDTGVGLHVGYVPGVAASHGCIRLKKDTAEDLFSLVKVGTPVTISSAPLFVAPEKKSP